MLFFLPSPDITQLLQSRSKHHEDDSRCYRAEEGKVLDVVSLPGSRDRTTSSSSPIPREADEVVLLFDPPLVPPALPEPVPPTHGLPQYPLAVAALTEEVLLLLWVVLVVMVDMELESWACNSQKRRWLERYHKTRARLAGFGRTYVDMADGAED